MHIKIGFSTSFELLARILAAQLLMTEVAMADLRVTPPPKFIDSAMEIRAIDNRFPIDDEEFAHTKAAEWRACRRTRESTSFSPSYSNRGEDLSTFLETREIILSAAEMENSKLLTGKARRQPWSGDYWAIAKGVLGARYLQSTFMELLGWFERFEFIQKNSAAELILNEGAMGVAQLSPSEKYDLMIGDSKAAMTKSMWEQGKQYHDRDGKVETWMGICHGWAPAAIEEPRPAKAISVKSFDEKWDISLTPGEIKGLVSYSWATNRFSAITLGSRCNKKDPERDETGRLIDPECNDMNSGTWHIALVNKLGKRSQSFVIDATYDYEVWNQPVLEYEYTYFNPITQEKQTSLAAAQVKAKDWNTDPYAKHRDSRVESIVGISLRLAYVLESGVDTESEDNPERDVIRWVRYKYDLELDAAGNIIGGEWHQGIHPDFIWVPRMGLKPQSPLDRVVANQPWDRETKIPELWSAAAKQGARTGVILNALTDALLKKSAQ